MTASIKSVQVLPGSIVLLSGLTFPGDTYQEMITELRDHLVRACGHDRFVLIDTANSDGEVEVWGPDTDLKAKVAELLADKQAPQPAPA